MSSRSSSAAASSLRLVKMSEMPREIAEDERESPAVSRESQLRLGAAGSAAMGAGAGAASPRAKRRRSKPVLAFSSPVSFTRMSFALRAVRAMA